MVYVVGAGSEVCQLVPAKRQRGDNTTENQTTRVIPIRYFGMNPSVFSRYFHTKYRRETRLVNSVFKNWQENPSKGRAASAP